MQELIVATYSRFLSEPLPARTAAPAIIERAASQPWCAASRVARPGAGWPFAETVLVEAAAGRAAALEAARTLLTGRAA